MDIALLDANILNDKHGSKTPFLQFKMKVDRKKLENYENFRIERHFTDELISTLREVFPFNKCQ